MLKVEILTLFPDLFKPFLENGLMSRAVKESHAEITMTQLRNYAINTHGQVDDSPYGGGSGMVLRVDAASSAIKDAKKRNPNSSVVLFTPRGRPLSQTLAREIVGSSREHDRGLILLCPRYEGCDERFAEEYVDYEVSIGDFIAMGGEIPAMAFLEAVIRLIPGVLGNPESTESESFETGLLEYPQYTKPQEFEGLKVPEELTSGNHALIKKWRADKSFEDSVKRRPDLIKSPIKPKGFFAVALIHHPVMGKAGSVITSSITNIDLHDIARSARTYGVDNFYVPHPIKTLRQLAENICDHWATGFGLQYNPNRSDALSLIRLMTDFDDILIDVENRFGKLPKIITTSAKKSEKSFTFTEMRQHLLLSPEPHVLLLGTGWGLAPEILSRADYHLEPIVGATDYNHLSVRAAAAIMFDKLLGAR